MKATAYGVSNIPPDGGFRLLIRHRCRPWLAAFSLGSAQIRLEPNE
jgi:hypothetical protein